MVTRIRQLLDWQQLSPTQFADSIGVGRPVISHILSERNKPSLEVVQRIIAAFPSISLPWLLSGTGEMLAVAAPGEATAAPAAPIATDTRSPLASPAVAAKPITPVSERPRAASSVAAPATRRSAPAPAKFRISKPLGAPIGPLTVAPPSQEANAAATAVSAPLSPSAEQATPTHQEVAAAPAPLAASPSLAAEAAALLPFLSEPGKAIRRIVIFYRDGSFADYLPEA